MIQFSRPYPTNKAPAELRQRFVEETEAYLTYWLQRLEQEEVPKDAPANSTAGKPTIRPDWEPSRLSHQISALQKFCEK